MIRKTYNKLVRDKIIEIILEDGGNPVFRILNENEFKKYCKEKIVEESKELAASESRDDIVNELSDVLELIYTIANANNIDIEELENKRLDKRNKKGGFDKKIFLEYSDELK